MKKNKVWALLAPIVVLVLIGGIITTALAFTNEATAPVIAEAQRVAAEKAKQEVLPEGADFAVMENVEGLNESITEVSQAGNGAGFVVTVDGKGFDKGLVVMIGLDGKGAIVGVKVLSNNETAGIGSKVVEAGSEFLTQLPGMTDTANVQATSGATMSSNGVKNAVQAAFDAYVVLSGGTVEAKVYEAPANLTDEVLAEYYPGASFTDVTGGKTSDAGTVVYAASQGMMGEVPVAVLFNTDGKIIAVVADTSAETPEYGQPLGEGDYMDNFVGVTSGSEVDAISGVTLTSNAIKDAVDIAIANLSTVKGAA